jgi:sugar phosphate isomerase/epimerase
MARYPLGVVEHAFNPDDSVRASERARDLGFAHIDVRFGVDPQTLALPVGCFTAAPAPQPGRTTTPAPSQGAGRWELAVRKFREALGCLMEPWAGSVVNSVETARAMMAEVPGLRLLVDTGHVADWGGDPLEMLAFADHVQLRQGRPGCAQLHVDDPTGVVDFAAVLRRLDTLNYQGLLSVEHFDRPELGLGLDEPLSWAMDLARHMRSLMDDRS